MLYVGFGSFGDTDPYHGWVIGFNATNLQQVTNYAFASTPNASLALLSGSTPPRGRALGRRCRPVRRCREQSLF